MSGVRVVLLGPLYRGVEQLEARLAHYQEAVGSNPTTARQKSAKPPRGFCWVTLICTQIYMAKDGGVTIFRTQDTRYLLSFQC